MNAPNSLTDDLAHRIATKGPISIARYMADANAHYYASHDPLGTAGDFITAPEISQMFGELVGIWMADLWLRAGKPEFHFVELGPGRGTLAADALRAMRQQDLIPQVHFVETSPLLRTKQAAHVPHAIWHDSIESLPTDRPLLVIANEFFDALPYHQYVKTFSGWRERMVGFGADGFGPVPDSRPAESHIPARLQEAPTGSIYETSPAGLALMRHLAMRLAKQGGAALVIDYGHENYDAGDTLQALSAHAYADVFSNPGKNDLTAHVDFTAMVKTAQRAGGIVQGPVSQSFFLGTMGISARAAMLAKHYPERIDDIGRALRRLTHEDEMGSLFRAISIAARHWPEPAGF